MYKIILLSCFFTFNIYAQNESLLYDFKTTMENLEKKKCRLPDKGCYISTLEYPKQITSSNIELAKHLNTEMQKIRAKFDSMNITQDMLPEKDFINYTYENSISYSININTTNTYTIQTNAHSYTGGAHGVYATNFENFSINNHKYITLESLFIPGSIDKLKKIVEKHYRASLHLMPQESLTNSGWFDNEFVLTNNFEITSNGLNFLYNIYEIKSYADGATIINVPYYLLQDIIDPNSPIINEINKMKKPLHHHKEQFLFKDTAYSQKAKKHVPFSDIKINLEKIGSHLVKVSATMKNYSDKERGWFSLSFPQLVSKKSINDIHSNGFKNVQIYNKGSKVWNNTKKKAVHSKYLLVEGEGNPWKRDKEKIMKFIVRVPQNEDRLYVNIRGALRGEDKNIHNVYEMYAETIITGQQGFDNNRVSLRLKD